LYTGTIPTELGVLTALQQLDLSDMKGIVGTLPSEIAAMVSLELLNISNTSLTGVFPDQVCAMTMMMMQNHTILQVLSDCDHDEKNAKDQLQCCSNSQSNNTTGIQ
jgi:hypothetical protein